MRSTSGRKALIAVLAVAGAAILSGCAGDDGDYRGVDYGYAGPGVYDPFHDRYYDYDRVYYPDRHYGHHCDGDWRRRHSGDRGRDGSRGEHTHGQERGERHDGPARGGDRNWNRSAERSDDKRSNAGPSSDRSDGAGRSQTIRQQENIRSGGSGVGGGQSPAPARVAPGGRGGRGMGRDDG